MIAQVVIMIMLLCSRELLAEVIHLTPDDDWFAILSGERLKPGDEVVLRAGKYSSPRRLAIRSSGTTEKPIVIRADEGARVVFERPDARQNTFNLEGTQYLELRGFEITGGAAGIRIGPLGDRQSSDVKLTDLHIHHIGGVAVTCNQDGAHYERMVFRGNHIHHTAGHGEAFYLGGNDASAIFSDSIIDGNYIHHLNGPDVSQGDGIEIKQGSYGNRVTNNVIHDTKYPGITVYGTGGRARNVIFNNMIWNTGDHGIQVAADAVVLSNVVFKTGGCGIYSREHQGAIPGHLLIEQNDIRDANSAALRIIRPGNGYSGQIELQHNQLFARPGQPAMRVGPDALVHISGNRGRGGLEALPTTTDGWQELTTEVKPKAFVLPKHHPANLIGSRD